VKSRVRSRNLAGRRNAAHDLERQHAAEATGHLTPSQLNAAGWLASPG